MTRQPLVGAQYTLVDRKTGLVLDSNSAGKAYPKERNGGGFQKWVAQRDGEAWVLINLQTGLALDSNGTSVYTHTVGSSYQRWAFEEPGDGYLRVRHVQSGRVLDSNQTDVYLLDANGGEYQQWTLEHTPVVLSASVVDLDYSTAVAPPTTPKVIGTFSGRNDSPDNVLHIEQVIHGERSSTFTWGLTETLGASLMIGGKVGVPFVAEGSTELTFSVEISAHQEWSKTETLAYSALVSADLHPNTAAVFKATVDWTTDVNIPFKMRSAVHGSIAPGIALPSAYLIDYLKSTGCTAELTAMHADPYGVEVLANGTLTGAWGVSTRAVMDVVLPGQLTSADVES